MLRRNVGRGRAPIEGLQVRWHFVANLLQALTAYARNEPWRLGGGVLEPMHKHYDSKLFDVVTDEEELRLRFAPKRAVEGDSLLGDADAESLTRHARHAVPELRKDILSRCVDVDTVDRFIAAGFDVTVTGPGVNDVPAGAARAGQCVDDVPMVEEDVFVRWLGLAEMRVSVVLSRWWCDLDAGSEGDEDVLKSSDDATALELFERIRVDIVAARDQNEAAPASSTFTVQELVAWLKKQVPAVQTLDEECGSDEMLADQVILELAVVARRMGGADEAELGCAEEGGKSLVEGGFDAEVAGASRARLAK